MGQVIVDATQITGTQLAERFLVDPDTGRIFACRDVQKTGQKLVPVGHLRPGLPGEGGGYCLINFPVGYRKYRKLRAHHVVWAWVHGEWPSAEIDHINGDRSDNRISNLRAASAAQNRINRRNSASRTSGYKWVTRNKNNGRWIGQVEAPLAMTKNGKRRMLFRQEYDTPEEAHEAASNFAKTIHGDWFNPGAISQMGG